jgi:hypothetical protein
MQIHELTQPKKTKLDEIEVFGSDGLAAKLGDVWKTRGKSLISRDAEMAAEKERYAAQAAKYAGQLQQELKPVTVDQALAKLKTNPGAQQWIDGVVAKWPAAAKTIRDKVEDEAKKRPTMAQDIQAKLGPPPTATPPTPTPPTPTPPTATLGGKPLDPKNPNDATVLAALAKQGIKEDPATPGGATVAGAGATVAGKDTWGMRENDAYAAAVKAWIGTQLKTTTVDEIEKAVPELQGKINSLLRNIAYGKDNLPEQQKLVHELFSWFVAGNHVAQSKNPEQNKNQGTQGTGNQQMMGRQPRVETGLDDSQIKVLRQAASAAGGPPPGDTGNAFFNSLISQIRGLG